MNEIEKEMRKQIADGDFAMSAANSLDHAILALTAHPRDARSALDSLTHHRNCMLILHDQFRIVERDMRR